MIPVPSESLSDSKIQQPNAWEIAQEALKKVTPSASSSSAFPRMSYAQSFANPMQQYYSWAPSYGLSLPVLPVQHLYPQGYENMYASFYASCSGNRFSPPLPPPPPPPPAPPQAVYRSKNIPTSIASSNEVSRPLRMSFRPVRAINSLNTPLSHPIRFNINRSNPPNSLASTGGNLSSSLFPNFNYPLQKQIIPVEIR